MYFFTNDFNIIGWLIPRSPKVSLSPPCFFHFNFGSIQIYVASGIRLTVLIFLHLIIIIKTNSNNFVAWVREWTMPSERPPLVGEVSANFCGYRVPRGRRDGSLRPIIMLANSISYEFRLVASYFLPLRSKYFPRQSVWNNLDLCCSWIWESKLAI
jgi:hypothetical protein